MNFLELWYQALQSPYGIVVLVNDVERGRTEFYQARKKACDPDLAALALVRPPVNTEGELWIVKKVRPSNGAGE